MENLNHNPGKNFTNISWVFFGSDNFSTKVLDTILGFNIKPNLIVTTPDRPQGRKLLLTPPRVKIWAQENNIPIIQPENFTDLPAELTNYKFDLGLVASYGKILPQNVLDLFGDKLLNIHPSLLPKFRGATPLESAILSADDTTGVSLMIMDALMDHGPILAQKETVIDNKNYLNLRDELAETGAELFIDYGYLIHSDQIESKNQNHDLATYTKKINKSDGEIKLDDDPILNWKKYRAFSDWPGIFFFTPDNKRIKITQAHLENDQFVIDKVIPEGKKEMAWESFNKNL